MSLRYGRETGCEKNLQPLWAILIALATIVSMGLTIGCSNESQSSIKHKLDIILQGDLTGTAAEFPKSSLRDSMYYRVVSFTMYPEGQYSARAIADFYLLRKSNSDTAKTTGMSAVMASDMKMVRKYRYVRLFGMWERYYNKWHLDYDTTAQLHP